MVERKAGRKNGEKTARQAAGRFGPGNPGRPRGAKNRVTVAVQTLLDGQAEALTEKAIAAALKGDGFALKLCLDRIAPAPKSRRVDFKIPPLKSAADVPKALAAIVKAVAAGDLAPDEAASLSSLVERFLKAVEMADLEKRIEALERNQDHDGKIAPEYSN